MKQAFNQLHNVFIKMFILRHFDSEWHIHIEINTFNYAVADILSQSDNEDQWYLIAFWFRMMINVERNYEMHNQKLLVIVMMFKHWWHYVEDNYHNVEILTDHNNLKNFMNVWKLNEKQVKWIMKLLICNFEITHRSEKTNSINASLRKSDYKNENIFANHLLFTLQRKLTRIESLNSFFFLILTWFNTHYEFMQDFIYCSERCASVALFLHWKSLLSALYTITVFNARTLWICFFFILFLFYLILWWCHSLKLIQYAHWKYHLNDHHCCAHDF